MGTQHISSRVKNFIKEHLQSVFRLEVLLLLHGARTRSFTNVQVADELGFGAEMAHEQLEALAGNGLLSCSGNGELRYRYDPIDQQAATMVDELASAYAKQRVPILSLILAEHSDRIRGFAEAFRLTRENN